MQAIAALHSDRYRTRRQFQASVSRLRRRALLCIPNLRNDHFRKRFEIAGIAQRYGASVADCRRETMSVQLTYGSHIFHSAIDISPLHATRIRLDPV